MDIPNQRKTRKAWVARRQPLHPSLSQLLILRLFSMKNAIQCLLRKQERGLQVIQDALETRGADGLTDSLQADNYHLYKCSIDFLQICASERNFMTPQNPPDTAPYILQPDTGSSTNYQRRPNRRCTLGSRRRPLYTSGVQLVLVRLVVIIQNLMKKQDQLLATIQHILRAQGGVNATSVEQLYNLHRCRIQTLQICGSAENSITVQNRCARCEGMFGYDDNDYDPYYDDLYDVDYYNPYESDEDDQYNDDYDQHYDDDNDWYHFDDDDDHYHDDDDDQYHDDDDDPYRDYYDQHYDDDDDDWFHDDDDHYDDDDDWYHDDDNDHYHDDDDWYHDDDDDDDDDWYHDDDDWYHDDDDDQYHDDDDPYRDDYDQHYDDDDDQYHDDDRYSDDLIYDIDHQMSLPNCDAMPDLPVLLRLLRNHPDLTDLVKLNNGPTAHDAVHQESTALLRMLNICWTVDNAAALSGPVKTTSLFINGGLHSQCAITECLEATPSANLKFPDLKETACPDIQHFTESASSEFPPVTESANPQFPHVTESAHPQFPQVTKSAHPQFPPVTESANPEFPPVTESAHPQFPPVTESAHPQFPPVTESAHPQFPQVSASAHPQFPQVTTSANPAFPQVTASAHLETLQVIESALTRGLTKVTESAGRLTGEPELDKGVINPLMAAASGTLSSTGQCMPDGIKTLSSGLWLQKMTWLTCQFLLTLTVSGWLIRLFLCSDSQMKQIGIALQFLCYGLVTLVLPQVPSGRRGMAVAQGIVAMLRQVPSLSIFCRWVVLLAVTGFSLGVSPLPVCLVLAAIQWNAGQFNTLNPEVETH